MVGFFPPILHPKMIILRVIEEIYHFRQPQSTGVVDGNIYIFSNDFYKGGGQVKIILYKFLIFFLDWGKGI